MPEISFCLFDLRLLFNLFPKEDREYQKKIEDFVSKAEEDMAENRLKLFSDFGYESEFDNSYSW